jgi:hypothetical protein
MSNNQDSLAPQDLRNDINKLFMQSCKNQYEAMVLKCMVASMAHKLLPGEVQDIWRFSLQRAKSLLQNDWPKASFEEQNVSCKRFLEQHSIRPVD